MTHRSKRKKFKNKTQIGTWVASQKRLLADQKGAEKGERQKKNATFKKSRKKNQLRNGMFKSDEGRIKGGAKTYYTTLMKNDIQWVYFAFMGETEGKVKVGRKKTKGKVTTKKGRVWGTKKSRETSKRRP